MPREWRPFVAPTLTPCILCTTGAILQYFRFSKPLWLTAVILAGYLSVMHVLTYAAYRIVGRRERR